MYHCRRRGIGVKIKLNLHVRARRDSRQTPRAVLKIDGLESQRIAVLDESRVGDVPLGTVLRARFGVAVLRLDGLKRAACGLVRRHREIGAGHTFLRKAQVHHIAPVALAAAVEPAVVFRLVRFQRNIGVIAARTPRAGFCRAVGIRAEYGPLAVLESGTLLGVVPRERARVPVADDVAAVFINARFREDFAVGCDSVRHAEMVDIIVQRVVVAPAHEPRTARVGIVKFVGYQRHSGVVVIFFRQIRLIRGVAQNQTVLVRAERAVRDCAEIRVIAAGEEFVLVHLAV